MEFCLIMYYVYLVVMCIHMKQMKKLEKSVEAERKKVAELQEAPEKCASEIQELEEQQEELVEKKSQEEKNLEKVMENIKTETQVRCATHTHLAYYRIMSE